MNRLRKILGKIASAIERDIQKKVRESYIERKKKKR
jgi:hypothetical protein